MSHCRKRYKYYFSWMNIYVLQLSSIIPNQVFINDKIKELLEKGIWTQWKKKQSVSKSIYSLLFSSLFHLCCLSLSLPSNSLASREWAERERSCSAHKALFECWEVRPRSRNYFSWAPWPALYICDHILQSCVRRTARGTPGDGTVCGKGYPEGCSRLFIRWPPAER